MCKMFEVVTGRKSKGSVDKLEGLTKAYTDMHEDIAIIRIPVELMEVDSRYQTDERTERELKYLTNNWDERKLMPLLGVPHWEEGKVYIVDGYGRWIASQIVDKDKYKDLKVQLILNAPTEDSERVAFEAELYAFQGISVRKVTPIQRHGAMLVLHDPATETLEKMKNIYGFAYREKAGNRGMGVLGSYTEALSLCAIDNGACAEYVYDYIFSKIVNSQISHNLFKYERLIQFLKRRYFNDCNNTELIYTIGLCVSTIEICKHQYNHLYNEYNTNNIIKELLQDDNKKKIILKIYNNPDIHLIKLINDLDITLENESSEKHTLIIEHINTLIDLGMIINYNKILSASPILVRYIQNNKVKE